MNLIKSTGTFSFFTIVSRILGYLRDILIAIFLGAGPLADAFFVAFRIPNTFRRLYQVTHQSYQMEKILLKNLQQMFLAYLF